MDKMQKTETLPVEKARTLLVELMHGSFDTVCSEAQNGYLTVTWPASLNVGKQLNGEMK